MKKKVLSLILCLSMLLSGFALAATAAPVDLTDPNATWGDSTSLKLTTTQYTSADHRTMITMTDEAVKVDNTLTFWFKPDTSTAGVMNAFPIKLVSYNSIDATYLLTELTCNPFRGDTRPGFTAYGYNYSNGDKTVDLNVGEWNRVDIVIDYTESEGVVTGGTMSAYLNYTQFIASKELTNAANGYIGILIPSTGRSNCVKSAYMDNMMIRAGLHAPEKGDLASNLAEAALIAEKDEIIYFEGCDGIAAGKTAGCVWNPNGACWSVDTTQGIAKQDGAALRGIQTGSTTAAGVTTYNTRFVSTLDSLNYYEVGYVFEANGNSVSKSCTTVYDSIIGSTDTGVTETYTALGEFGANYLYCITLTGMAADTAYTVTVTPYTVATKGAEPVYGTPVTLTLQNGAQVVAD